MVHLVAMDMVVGVLPAHRCCGKLEPVVQVVVQAAGSKGSLQLDVGVHKSCKSSQLERTAVVARLVAQLVAQLMAQLMVPSVQ